MLKELDAQKFFKQIVSQRIPFVDGQVATEYLMPMDVGTLEASQLRSADKGVIVDHGLF